MGNGIKKELRVARDISQGIGYRLLVTGYRQRATGNGQRGIVYLMYVIAFSALLSCGTPRPTMDGIDLTVWKNDKNGCGGFREKMTELVIQQKDKLLSLTETDIVSLLGKPDETELYKRNEKFYKYYFTNGPGCAGTATRKSITLRFNAMGLLKEAVVD